MTLIYNSGVRSLITSSGIRDGFSNPSMTMYAGTQPTPTTLINSWSSYNYNTSNFLWHAQTGLTLLVTGSGVSIFAVNVPSAVPVRSGTASWAVIWSGAVTTGTMTTSSIPSSSFMICPVSLNTSNGVVRLTSTTLSAGTTATIADLGFTVLL